MHFNFHPASLFANTKSKDTANRTRKNVCQITNDNKTYGGVIWFMGWGNEYGVTGLYVIKMKSNIFVLLHRVCP